MDEQQIEFRRTRDFGENLNDSFLFIRQNFRPLFRSFFLICSIFMIVHALLQGLYPSTSLNALQWITGRAYLGPASRYDYFNLQYYMVKLSEWLTYIAVDVAIGSYIKYYVENNGAKPAIEQVWAIFKKYYFKVLLISIPVFIATILATFACIAPGVYILVVMMPYSIITLMEDANLPETFARCFELIRNNFWSSFLIYMVALALYFVSSFIVSLLISTLVSFSGLFTSYNLLRPASIISSFLHVFIYSFYSVVSVSVALNYFNLVERRDGTGLLSRINKIGGSSKVDHESDQY